MQAKTAMDTMLARMPPDVADSFSDEQRAALYQAVNPQSWRRHAVDMRLSLPVPGTGRRYFITMVGGWDRRHSARVRRERKVHPLHTTGNLSFLLGMGTAFCAALVGITALARFLDI